MGGDGPGALLSWGEGVLKPLTLAVLSTALGLVFLVSGVTKARALWQVAFAIVDFGITRSPSRLTAQALVVAELGVATTLIAGPFFAKIVFLSACVASFLFLVLFSMLISRALRNGKSFSCNCFGASQATIGPRSLQRNMALLILNSIVLLGIWVNRGDLPLKPHPAEASITVSVLGIVALAASIPKLARWNRDPFTLRADSGA